MKYTFTAPKNINGTGLERDPFDDKPRDKHGHIINYGDYVRQDGYRGNWRVIDARMGEVGLDVGDGICYVLRSQVEIV